MKPDYDALARAMKCPWCGAKKGEKCFGARPGTRKLGTHYSRRALVAEERWRLRNKEVTS